ncbi:hypothetical protein FACS189492_0910 [Clostridia bacterium]|nr:hypothetical protein FACS189492_0910 [Clostridia bacterium]
MKKLTSVLVAALIITNVLGVAAANANIYLTDFDGYRFGNGNYVPSALVSLQSAYGNWVTGNGTGASVVGSQKDASHGTSLSFPSGGWFNTSLELGATCSGKVRFSFEFLSESGGTIRVLGNNANNFAVSFVGTSAKPELNDGQTLPLVQNVITLGNWVRADIYIDDETDMFAFYVDGVLVGEPHPLYSKKTALGNIQFQKVSGGEMWIDNVSVTQIDEMPVLPMDLFAGRDCIIRTDFTRFSGGANGYPGFVFQGQSLSGGVIAAQVDAAHGTSMKIVDLYGESGIANYTINGYVALPEALTEGKCVWEFEIFPEAGSSAPLSMSARNTSDLMTVSGLRIKAGARDDGTAQYNANMLLREWNKVQMYLDLDNDAYIVYLNGKKLEDARSLKRAGAIDRLYYLTYLVSTSNHAAFYIDNLAMYWVEGEINVNPIDYTLSVLSDDMLEVRFSDGVDPSLLNANNLGVYAAGGGSAEIGFAVSEKSYYGFRVRLAAPMPANQQYKLALSNIHGLGGQATAKKYVEFSSAKGVYANGIANTDTFAATVEGTRIRVVNTKGVSDTYTLVIGYYANNRLQRTRTFAGNAKPENECEIYDIPQLDERYDIRVFLIRGDTAQMIFDY